MVIEAVDRGRDEIICRRESRIPRVARVDRMTGWRAIGLF